MNSHDTADALRTGDAPTLLDSLSADDPGARAFAACGVQVHALDAPSEALSSLAEDENWIVRACAARAIGARASDPERASDTLASLLNDPEAAVRRLVIQSLGELAITRHASAIVDAFAREDDPLLRAASVRALGALGDPASLPTLLSALGDPGLLGEAVQALGALGDPGAIGRLVALYTDGVNGFIEWWIVAALRDIGAREETLALCASHPSASTRRMLGRVAGEWWPDEPAVRALLRAMEDPEPTVRAGAAFRLGPRKLDAATRAEVLAAITRGLEDEDADVRHWCEETMAKWEEHANA